MGKPGLGMKYFVLKPRAKGGTDPWARASQTAMYSYAGVIEDEDPILAADLRVWADQEVARQERHRAAEDRVALAQEQEIPAQPERTIKDDFFELLDRVTALERCVGFRDPGALDRARIAIQRERERKRADDPDAADHRQEVRR